MAPVRYYDSDKNPDGVSLPGVGLRDLDEEEFAAFPKWLQDSIDASPMYRKTKVPTHSPAQSPRRTTDADAGKE